MRLLLSTVFIYLTTFSYGQLYINEFMASNASTIEDPDFSDDADWIEIYNAGGTVINLNGYYLTDDLSIPNRWKIGNLTIPAKGFLLFWADGKNSNTHTNFKLDALTESIGLFNTALQCVDSVSYSNQYPDVSQGRNITNPSTWGFFTDATPNTPNASLFYSGFALNVPHFSKRGGIYKSNTSIILTNQMGGEIRYTLDGSEPTASSMLYSNPIFINKTTVVRSRIFKTGLIPGPIITNTYFINENLESHGLPVVSIATNPDNLWNPQIGIYVQNFKPDWEIPVNIELFENNGSDRSAFNELAGIKINGLYSWQLPQKMLGVYFSKQYGSGSLDFPVFYDTPRASYKNFALRASGNDWSNTLMRDILGQHATQFNMDLDISAFRWCTVYFNGQYMGIHNFREKIETDYIEEHYGLAEGTFDMVENEDYPECGDLNAYNELKTLFSKDLSVQSDFDAVAEKMDIENFTDLVITEIATGNSSIDHNVMAWKPKDSGKWRWILMDLDRGFFSVNSRMIIFYLDQTSFPFQRLMQNTTYKKYFGQKLADHLYTSFHPAIMTQLIENHLKTIEPEIPNHVERWLGTTSTYGNAMPSVDYWYNEVAKIKSYVQQRPQALLNDLTNYGFSGSALLSVSAYPENAGILKLNGLKIPQTQWDGAYLKQVNATLTAEEKAGYVFKGWKSTIKKALVPKQSIWKFIDNGSNQETAWVAPSFNDDNWSAGQGELGYGDGDENTVVGFGPNSDNKFTTTYFRHLFTLTDADLTGTHYTIELMKDDGAIIYLNGTELVRDNMTYGPITNSTLASISLSGADESEYTSYLIDKNLLKTGINVLAVEVHQNSVSSSDISFDLALNCLMPANNGYLSTQKDFPFTLTGDLSVMAVFEASGECMVPAEITQNTTLYKSCSPYLVQDNVTIQNGVTLTIEPGVELWMSGNSNFYIHGNIEAIGTETDRIVFKINPKYEPRGWGALNFWNSSATSSLSYVTISDATRGPVPERVGAISTFYGNLNLDHLLIENTKLNPLSARYSDISLTNSIIHSSASSDLINIKYGKATIENCTLIGNGEFDSDGIDYDGIENGIIRNTSIYNILGYNADAIDIGEEASLVKIDCVLICNVFDKGISVGQQSSVILINSLVANCNVGIGVKDSSRIDVNRSTFYGNGTSVSCYEKNPGLAGGNAAIKNSILSNTHLATFQSDSKSSTKITYSLSDNEPLPANSNNIWGNPEFTDPTHFDFTLLTSSPALGTGFDNGFPATMGAKIPYLELEPHLLICQLYLNPLNNSNLEYLALYNPAANDIDASGFSIDKGVTCTFPSGTIVPAHDTLFVTDKKWLWDPARTVVQWTDGKLSNNGEAIQLKNQYGMVIDFINYHVEDGWPASAFESDDVMVLKSPTLDNHFPENWEAVPVATIVSAPEYKTEVPLIIYPNPATTQIHVQFIPGTHSIVEIYTPIGQLVLKSPLDAEGNAHIDLAHFSPGLYLVKVNNAYARFLKY